MAISCREILLWRIARPTPILLHSLLRCALIANELLDLLRVHILGNIICLPLLERETDPLIYSKLACILPPMGRGMACVSSPYH
jgi:hypothetical protein